MQETGIVIQNNYILESGNSDAKQGSVPVISVIMPCYNVEKYLRRAVDSVLCQTFDRIELILVDDGSTDKSASICDEYAGRDGRIRVIHTDNSGQGVARNIGFEAARGEFVGFVDADDYIEPKMYSVLLHAIMKFNCDAAICSYYEERDEAANPDCAWQTVSQVQSGSKGQSVSQVQSAGKVQSDVEVQSESAGQTVRQVRVSVMNQKELLTCLVEEDEHCPVRNAVWNKLYRRELIGSIRMAAHKYEDILFTAQVMCGCSRAAYVDMKLYHYIIDRKDSTMNQAAWQRLLDYQIPSYWKKDEALIQAGYPMLAIEHDYMVYKKLLLLYTDARNARTPESRDFMRKAATIIRGAKASYKELYSCRIADPHQKLRMRLFLDSPVLYNLFMDINEKVILPLRRRISA